MISKLLNFIKPKNKKPEQYSGFSDFFARASDTEKLRVIEKAALESNEEQFKIIEQARAKQKAFK
jgi:hypothetical protein